MTARIWIIAPAPVMLAGCNGFQNAMGGDGAEGANFVSLFKLFLIVCSVMYVIIVAAMLVAVWRRRKNALTVDDRRHHETSHVVTPVLFGWTALIVVGLTVLTVASFLTDRSNAANAFKPAMHLTVTANQWWWDVRYMSPEPSRIIRTANELHLPVGVPVHITLKSNDVIHSFWIPNLAGKQDLIPGRVNDISLRPIRQGVYRGQCAEFCGLQHAHMALDVTVESPAAFARWQQKQGQLPPIPTAPLARAGYVYVTTRECASCHNIAGTPASGQVAPDLTHFASRRSIGAGTFPMSRGHLYAWLADPQTAKPGNNMPYVGLEPRELHAIAAYLETLR